MIHCVEYGLKRRRTEEWSLFVAKIQDRNADELNQGGIDRETETWPDSRYKVKPKNRITSFSDKEK